MKDIKKEGKFIESDMHSARVLITAAVMNSINAVVRSPYKDAGITLDNIPYEILNDCLDKLGGYSINQSFNDEYSLLLKDLPDIIIYHNRNIDSITIYKKEEP